MVDGRGVGEVRKKRGRKTRGTAYLTVVFPAANGKRPWLGELDVFSFFRADPCIVGRGHRSHPDVP